ncbi:MAG TPA: hypothetical protein VIO64_19905 [Pseudobacteroides sp.]|uniref:hypothetical protein n=1 Tax=Pseudobacteroides sp. TaxID=1968840 RepID=UPI002F949A4F
MSQVLKETLEICEDTQKCKYLTFALGSEGIAIAKEKGTPIGQPRVKISHYF